MRSSVKTTMVLSSHFNLCIQLLKTLILNFKDTHRFFTPCERLRKFSYVVINDNRTENIVFIKNVFPLRDYNLVFLAMAIVLAKVTSGVNRPLLKTAMVTLLQLKKNVLN